MFRLPGTYRLNGHFMRSPQVQRAIRIINPVREGSIWGADITYGISHKEKPEVWM